MSARGHRRRVPEGEVDLNDQGTAIALIDQRRRDAGMTLLAMEKASGVSIGAYHVWRRNERSPLFGKFVALATALGFEVVLCGRGKEITAQHAVAVMEAVEAAAKAEGMHFIDLEVGSGFAISTLYAWRRGIQQPVMFALIAVAETCGFKLVMRPRT